MNNKAQAKVVEFVLDALKNGKPVWRKDWATTSGAHQNLITGHRYTGTNMIMFWVMEMTMPEMCPTPYWLTFNQIKAKKGKLRKGTKGVPVVFYKTLVVDDPKPGDPDNKKTIPYLNYTYVFNVAFVDGIENPAEKRIDFTPIERCEKIVAAIQNAPEIIHDGQDAFYQPSKHKITMPNKNLFSSVESYYGVLFHELVHSTAKALGRKMEPKTTVQEYSFEELIAEIGAAMLCVEVGISSERNLKNSAAYCANWLKALSKNPEYIVKAGSQAQKAVDYILNRNAESKEAQGAA